MKVTISFKITVMENLAYDLRTQTESRNSGPQHSTSAKTRLSWSKWFMRERNSKNTCATNAVSKHLHNFW